jgi:hypothetical protein
MSQIDIKVSLLGLYLIVDISDTMLWPREIAMTLKELTELISITMRHDPVTALHLLRIIEQL